MDDTLDFEKAVFKTTTGKTVLFRDFKKASDRFRSLFNNSKIYIYDERDFFSKIGGTYGGSLIVFIACPEAMYSQAMIIDKFRVLLFVQSGFEKNLKAEKGYIFADLRGLARYYSKSETLNTLYCAYAVDEDKMFFKPLIWMLNYYQAIKSKMPAIENEKGRKYYPIRIDPKVREEIVTVHGRRTAGSEFFLGEHHVAKIKCDKMIITEEEMTKFLNEHNCYPDSWKLNFKLAINLLKELT